MTTRYKQKYTCKINGRAKVNIIVYQKILFIIVRLNMESEREKECEKNENEKQR